MKIQQGEKVLSETDYVLQASYNFKSLMVNIRGRSPEEFEENLKAAEQLSTLIDQTGEALAANANKPVENEAEAVQNLQSAGMNPQVVGRTCQHGAMQLKSGGNWEAWMCPARQGDPSKCQPIDAKTGRPWPKKN